ncbi:MAG: GNAT family N-acetyltransferase [Acidobacteriota bacterium]|nr:GNAT family N-acetyltransferase [Acidobacteriota bacterium]
MDIRIVHSEDAHAWERMRQHLWPSPPGEHARDIAAYLAGDRRNPAAVFLACDDDGAAIGFAEVSIRTSAEGCSSDRVAYLEGWFVEEQVRRQGIGALLMLAVEGWGRAEGCTELASDTELHNDVGAAAHRALGFDEVERLVCFRKAL